MNQCVYLPGSGFEKTYRVYGFKTLLHVYIKHLVQDSPEPYVNRYKTTGNIY